MKILGAVECAKILKVGEDSRLKMPGEKQNFVSKEELSNVP